MNDLMIVESPTKAKKINTMFDNITVIATMGHFRDLPDKELGIDLETFKPEFVIEKKDTAKRIADQSKFAHKIYIAADLDREGEAIAFHVEQTIPKEYRHKIKRIRYSEVTKSAITQAIANSGEIDGLLVKAQIARRVLDRLVGYGVSPHLCYTLNQSVSAGRVQSPTLKLLCERDNQINNFKPENYYGVEIQKVNDQIGEGFSIQWDAATALDFAKEVKNETDSDDEVQENTNNKCRDRNIAEEVVVRAKKALTATVVDRQSKRKINNPPKPLITSKLLMIANNVLKLSAKNTMNAAQKLFEEGLITYHRTDSPTIDPEFVKIIREFATKQGLPIPNKPNVIKAAKGAQEAHEGVRVIELDYEPNNIVDDNQRKLFQIIRYHTIVSQLSAGVDESTVIHFVIESIHNSGEPIRDPFKTQGNVIIEQGWRVYQPPEILSKSGQNKENRLPKLNQGDTVVYTQEDVELQTKITKPPAKYTEASLIAKLEKLDIGRPSTYASIIQTLLTRSMIKLNKNHLIPTQVGHNVVKTLSSMAFMDYKYTADLEATLDKIMKGQARYQDALRQMYQQLGVDCKTTFNIEPNNLFISNTSNKVPKLSIDESDSCPQCKEGKCVIKTMTKGKGKGKKFYACSTFPECNLFQWVD